VVGGAGAQDGAAVVAESSLVIEKYVEKMSAKYTFQLCATCLEVGNMLFQLDNIAEASKLPYWGDVHRDFGTKTMNKHT